MEGAAATSTARPLGPDAGEPASHLHQRRGAGVSSSSSASSSGGAGGGGGLHRGASSSSMAGAGGSSGEDSRFECNICLDSPDEPVVTLCGHLFCWPCLYRWLNSNHTDCPVCKAGVTKENVIPLYGRGTEPVDPRTKPRRRGTQDQDVPGRPQAQRPEARPQPRGAGGGPGGAPFVPGFGVGGFPFGAGASAGGVSFSAGFGFFPSLFGLQFQHFTPAAPPSMAGGGNGGGSGSMTADEAQQAFLSKLLLMLGIFTLFVLIFA